ncbi:swr1 complex component [Knufia obscura]|uniref:DNA helicase n=1 Tax=Knufia obscura TaxID=1635080 RepID=A0ABR0RDN5_9EURO|nr:swr1 complex component [Knufia obscura]
MTDPATLAQSPPPTPSLTNGHSQHDQDTVVNSTEVKEEEVQQENKQAWAKNKDDAATPNLNGHASEHQEHPDAPPSKRRKLVEGTNSNDKPSPRAASPPWKKVAAEGPTSFLENGKRRSGRTNAIPLELQPASKKRQTRTSHSKATEKQPVRPVYSDTKKHKTEAPKHTKATSVDSNGAVRKGPARGAKPAPAPPVKKELSKKTLVKSPKTKEPAPANRKTDRISTVGKSKAELVQLKRELLQAQKQLVQDETESEDALEESSSSDESSHPPSPALHLKKVSFKVQIPKPAVITPANIPPAKKYESFEQFLAQDDIEEPGLRPLMSPDQVRKEAAKRLMVQRKRSGHLGGIGGLQKQPEPPRQYAHYDHLMVHAHHFRSLMRKEKKEHRRLAGVLADEAKKYVESKQAKGRVKTVEEIEQEQRLLWLSRYKTVVKDVGKLWQAVEAEVNAARLREYEQEQQEKIKGHLNRVLDRTDAMLKRHDTEQSGSDLDETDVDEDAEDAEDDTDGDNNSDNSEQMSASGSDSESSVEAEDPDETLTHEQLKAKYENVPDLEPDAIATPDPDAEMDDGAEDDSDPETVMDSELDSDEEDDEEDDDDNDDNESENETTGGLLSLFSKKEIKDMEEEPENEAQAEDHEDTEMVELQVDEVVQPDTEGDPGAGDDPNTEKPLIEELPEAVDVDPAKSTLTSQVAGPDDTPDPPPHDADSSRDHSDNASARTSVTKVAEVESVSSVEHQDANQQPTTLDDASQKHMTPVPPLLRGNLRVYQHEGLDWLANLYAKGRSGILADEMGLGKTIQSIALLAHLATTYQVWGPHLIVVPTSVMLNWEMEFKKFLPGFKILTYYGDIKERKAKRRGWMADDSFNVVITSYQLVLQDANSFKRRRWHYMILDEAHNIKNFRSERWQTMMTFNTRARLLLTGTPLQNNLTELWSLLFFLHYGQEQEGEDDAFAGLQEWSEWFKRPVQSILEHGKQVLDQEDQQQVAKLHKVIRPFLLRRLKRDVEKQMPLKYEHVEFCRLSKRQRQLYDGFMSRAQTRETLASGNYLSIINALMQLRKVCNHPDLFETRPVNTSFAMPRSVAAQFEVTDLLVRRKLFDDDPFSRADLDFLELVPVSRENMSKLQLAASSKWNAYQSLRTMRERQWVRVRNRSKLFATADREEVMSSLESVARSARLQHIDRTMYYEFYNHHQHPAYGFDLLQRIDFRLKDKVLSECALSESKARFWDRASIFNSFNLVQSLDARSRTMEPFVQQYACITPAAVAIDLPVTVIGESRAEPLRQHQAMQKYDPFHQAQMKLSIAFPDKRLLQYDCGKLQRLDKLLRQLQAGGHRALIFTQMTKVLDILEQFLNIHGHRYLRLDGATKIEQRQILTDRFNNDNRILCFILSSRSGGLGINLTGADTVIFYDLDWNPAMDRQCTDRAHRIGQTRDVHIYRFVSEHTIESNILRKANQKQLLDDVVIQEGDFTTDYINKPTYKDMLGDTDADDDDVAGAAMDRVLGNKPGDDKNNATAFEQAEDRDDVAAARVAEKEVQHADDGDFDEQPKPAGTNSKANALDPFSATNVAIAEAGGTSDGSGVEHIDEYVLRVQRYLLVGTPLVIKDRSKKGRNRKRGGERRMR